jgi:hypothetical protein
VKKENKIKQCEQELETSMKRGSRDIHVDRK